MRNNRALLRRALSSFIFSIALAMLPAVAWGDAPARPPNGMGKYFMFIAHPAPVPHGQKPKKIVPPDVRKFGGQEIYKGERYVVVHLPPAAVRQLRSDENVEFLQRIWMGETLEEWLETESPSAQPSKLATLSDADGPSWGPKAFEYDKSGNIKQFGGDTFAYDPVSRLKSSVTTGVTQTYTYDGFGNLTQIETGSEPPASFAVEAATNRVVSHMYDIAGNVIRDENGGYHYDSLGMMTGIAAGTGEPRRYYYTADDERIGFTMGNGFGRWYIRDFEGRVIREFRSDGFFTGGGPSWIWIEDYIYAAGQLVGAETIGPFATGIAADRRRRHFHLDHLGSVRLITTDSRTSLGSHQYYPFGKEKTSIIQEETNFGGIGAIRPEPMRFTSHERDFLGFWNAENDDYLDYMHARYYDPGRGRFLSVDPGGLDPKKPQSWNRYAYVMNNPVNAIDPNGKETYIVAHGEGELSPATQGQAYDVGRQFEIAANTRADQIRGSKGYNEARDDVVVVNTPNADALVAATNKQYSSGKIARVEVFSHAWSGGLNLGGAGNRHVTASTASQINTSNFTRNASFTLWGCNAGTPPSGGGRSFAQQLSNALQMPVRAHTGPTEFNNQGRGNPPMVPSNPQRGAMRVFNPENPNLLRLP